MAITNPRLYSDFRRKKNRMCSAIIFDVIVIALFMNNGQLHLLVFWTISVAILFISMCFGSYTLPWIRFPVWRMLRPLARGLLWWKCFVVGRRCRGVQGWARIVWWRRPHADGKGAALLSRFCT